MNDETLERLLIDRSLGLLPADTEALLVDYLRSNSDATDMAKQYDETVCLAKQALKGDSEIKLPTFPELQIKRAMRIKRHWLLIRNCVALAACVIIGIGLGAMMFNREPVIERIIQPVVLVDNTDRDAGAEITSHSSDFWSAKRIIEQYQNKPSRHYNSSLGDRWRSLLKQGGDT
ncbi:MAG: hypothetical protein ACYTF1_08110 [Planctomycetota bacterium]|jgi:hypothetical protein